MTSENANRDGNAHPTILVESSTTPGETMKVKVNPATGAMLAHADVGSWNDFTLDGATKIDPSNIDTGTVQGTDGAINISINPPGDCRLMHQGLVYYKAIPNMTADSLNTITISIQPTGATAGSPGTAQADRIYIACGVTSNPALLSTRASAIGYEHDFSASPRTYLEQGGSQVYGTAIATGRYVGGFIWRTAGTVRRMAGSVLTSLSHGNEGGQVSSMLILSSALTTDPLYIFFAVGRSSGGAYNGSVRFSYQVSPKI